MEPTTKRVIEKPEIIDTKATKKDTKALSMQEVTNTLKNTLERDLSAEQRLELLNRTMFKGFTPTEISLTVQKFKAMDANILAGDVWAYKDNKGNLIVIASRSFLQKKAEENPEFDGLQSWTICDADEFSMDTVSGDAKHVIKSFKDRGLILGSWAIAWRKNGKPVCVIADRKDYDKHQFIWASHTYAMMTKVAESIALRKFANLGAWVLGEWEYEPETKNTIERPTKPDLSKMEALGNGQK